MRKSAFTLIELLVVIAIIAILAAILFPVFAQAKMAAKKTAALSNVKNLGTAVQIYMGDFDDNFPLSNAYNPVNSLSSTNRFVPVPGEDALKWNPSLSPTAVAACNSFYANAMQPYIKSYAIWDDSTGVSTTSIYTLSFVGGMTYQNSTKNFSYAMNGLLNSFSSTALSSVATVPAFTLESQRKTPGAHFANPALDCTRQLTDVCTYRPNVATCGLAAGGGGVNGDSSFFSRASGGAGFHSYGGQWPVVFADSHAKTRKIGVYSSGLTDPKNEPIAAWNGTNGPTTGSTRRWWSSADGTHMCHSYMFRPDFDPSTPDTAYQSLSAP